MEKIGKYEIIEELGQGAMGKVYKAHDPQIDRFVAIKVISESVQGHPDVKERFQREARSAGKLAHENITVVYDYGEVEGMPYIVMEYLEGFELRKVINNDKEEQLTLFEKLNMAVQICNGLHYAHSKQIVHRDIKPENIGVIESGKIKIMDFGIAKLDTATYTQVGVGLGTPYYMSPEQIVGQKVDNRADIFAFGVVLHELLTGDRPFEGETADAVMFCIRYEPPKIAIKGTGFDEGLIAIVSKCLEKDRDSRYRDFVEVSKDISNVLQSGQQEITPALKDKGSRTLTYFPQARRRTLRPRVVLPVLLVLIMGSASGWLYFKKPTLNLKNLWVFGESRDTSEGDLLRTLPVNGNVALEKTSPDSIIKESKPPQPEGKEIESPAKTFKNNKPKPNPLLAEINQAQKNLMNAMLAVSASETEKLEDQNYQKALEGKNTAERELDKRNLKAALNSFRQATALFVKAPESILSAQKTKADGAKRAMEDVKDKMDPATRTVQQYEQGLQAETEATQAYDERNYNTAAERFQTASMLFTQANMDLMARKTAEMQKRQEVDKAIQTVTDAYKRSLEIGDIDGLRSLYANFNKEEEQQWSNVFKLIKNRRVVIAPAKREIVSDKAVVVDLLVGIFYKDNRNEERKINYEYQWTLEKVNNNWLIASFAVSNISNE